MPTRTGGPELDAGLAWLHATGVVLLVLQPGEAVIAGFRRNLERTARALEEGRAQLRVAHGSELLDVDITPAFLRAERRTAWRVGDVGVDLDLEPLPGVGYGALLLDAPPVDPDDGGPPWASEHHRAAITAARAVRRLPTASDPRLLRSHG